MVQDPSSNELENRQSIVSKRLTKAISAVPRARFQKARPKLPSCKRSDSSTTPVALKSTSEGAEFNSTDDNKLKLSKNISSQSKEEIETTPNDKLPENLETTQNKPYKDASKAIDDNADISKADNASGSNTPKAHVLRDSCQKISETPDSADSILRSTQSVESNRSTSSVEDVQFNSVKDKLKSSEDIKNQLEEKIEPASNYKLPKILEITQNNSYAPKTFDISKAPDPCDINKNIPKTQDLSDSNKNIPEPHGPDNFNKNIPDSNDTRDSNQYVSKAHDTDSVQSCTHVVDPNEASNRLPTTPPVEEHNDVSSSVTPTAATDRASKYPHLTSILSKKRTEPKKDTTHKRRRKYLKGDPAPERSKMTMADLIYWNPTSSDPGLKSSAPVSEIVSSSNDILEESHEVDEPQTQEEEMCSSVPKLVISEDGQINIDQVSLVVSRKKMPEPTISQVVRNEETTYSSFRKRPLTKQWTTKDTYIFYKALSLVGTDFALMEKLLPHRTRRELKLKFKREEKYNIDLINKAMYESHPTFDGKDLEEHVKNLNSVTEDFELDCMQENDHPVKEKKPRGRKRKGMPKVLLNEDEQCLSPTQSVEDAGTNIWANTKPRGRKRKVAKVLSDDSESSVSPTKSKKDTVSGKIEDVFENEARNKRKRTKRKLPEGFIDIDDIEDITECVLNPCVNGFVSKPNFSATNVLDHCDSVETPSEIPVPFDQSSSDKMCEGSTNIQIICLEERGDVNESSSLVVGHNKQLVTSPETSKKSANIQIICLKDDIEEFSRLGSNSINQMLPEISESKESPKIQIIHLNEDITRGSNLSKAVLVTDNQPSVILPQYIGEALEHPRNTLQTSVDQNECMVDLVADNVDSSEITAFSNVMANEVVTSLEPASKRKKKVNAIIQKYKKAKIVPKIHRKINEHKESSHPFQPSSFNYTPLEDSLLENKSLEFTPKSCKTYSKSNPVSPSILINSFQKALSSPEHSNNLFTTLNASKNSQHIPIPLTSEHSSSLLSSFNASQNQSIAIPLEPESNSKAPSDSVLFLTKSSNTDNVIHLFMYKNPSA